MKVKILLLGLLSLLVLSCREYYVNSLLTQAEEMMDISPDSALVLLNSLEYPEDLKSPKKELYHLLLVWAKDKASADVSADTAIYEVAAYFSLKNDLKRATLANFYASRVAYANNHAVETNAYLVAAKEFAEELKEYHWLGMIYYDLGFVFQREFNLDLAKENYMQAQAYFSKAQNEKNASYVNEAIGYVHLLEGLPENEVLPYYEKALNYAISLNDSSTISSLYKGIGVVYLENGKQKRARKYIAKAIDSDKKGQFKPGYYELLSRSYLNEMRYDSAMYYAESLGGLIDTIDNQGLTQRYYSLLSEINERLGLYKESLSKYKLLSHYKDDLYEINMRNSIAEIQEKYHTEKVRNAYNRVLLHRQFLVLIMVLITSIAGFLLWIFSVRVKKKNAELMEAEDNLEILNRMLSEKDNRENQFKTLLIEKLEVAKRVAQMEVAPTKDHNLFLKRYNTVFNESLQKVLDWSNLYPLINDLYGGFVDKVAKLYPQLNEKDVQMCCLIRAGFANNEIAFILSYTYESVRVRKVDLRKKMGFPSNAEFVEFLSAN